MNLAGMPKLRSHMSYDFKMQVIDTHHVAASLTYHSPFSGQSSLSWINIQG